MTDDSNIELLYQSNWDLTKVTSTDSHAQVIVPANCVLPFVGYANITVQSGSLLIGGVQLTKPHSFICSLPFGPLLYLQSTSEATTFTLHNSFPTQPSLPDSPPMAPLYPVTSFIPISDPSSCSYTPLVIPPCWESFAQGQGSVSPQIYFVVGAKDSGKSVFCSYLSSFLTASRNQKVTLIDLDCGQSFFAPPNHMSAVSIKSIVTPSSIGRLLNAESNSLELIKTFSFASNTPSSDIPFYIDLACRLFKFVISNFDTSPIVINTCGWTSGFGKELLITLLGKFQSYLSQRGFKKVSPIILASETNVSDWQSWGADVINQAQNDTSCPVIEPSYLVFSLPRMEKSEVSLELDYNKLKPQILRDSLTFAWLNDLECILGLINKIIELVTTGSVKVMQYYELLTSQIFEKRSHLVDLRSLGLVLFSPPLYLPSFLTKISNSELYMRKLGSNIVCYLVSLYFDENLEVSSAPKILNSRPSKSAKLIGFGLIKSFDCFSNQLQIVTSSFHPHVDLYKVNILAIQLGFPNDLLRYRSFAFDSSLVLPSFIVDSTDVVGSASSVPKRKHVNRTWA
ncbi:hypothetical protein P9112_006499 [Eukaryota sp. TZLM1-RC]